MKLQTSPCRVVVALCLWVCAAAAHAQASRTWVSGVGDDLNPCSRTAPCKTFAGAISKTAPGGVIDVLDPGAFGAVTITKAITIENGGSFAGILGAGINGIIVNAAATDSVILRGLTFEGLGTGINGIRFLAGPSLSVENCQFNRFTQNGISFEPSGNSLLVVKNTVISNNNFGGGGGLNIVPGASGNATVQLEHVRTERNSWGIRVENRSKVTITDSVFVKSSNEGIRANSTVAVANNVTVNVVSTDVSLGAGIGVQAIGTGAIVRLSNVSIFNNGGAGISATSGGAVNTFGNNHVAGNNPDGAPTLPALPST